jgi:hypothetical protein
MIVTGRPRIFKRSRLDEKAEGLQDGGRYAAIAPAAVAVCRNFRVNYRLNDSKVGEPRNDDENR